MTEMSNKTVKLISDSDALIYLIVNNICLNNLLCLIGSVTNVINIIVFFKQGFASTMNISFFGLAISDLSSLITLMVYITGINPLFANFKIPLDLSDVLYLTAGLPHCCFARITGWITVYITAERCLCITFPLKIKEIITPKKTTIIVCAIYIFVIASFLPEYATSYIGWKFHPGKNRTLLAMVFTENRGDAEGVLYILYSILGSVSFVAVIVFTVILVVQLKQTSKWRKTANEDKTMVESISNRERKTVTMVIMITTVLIVCSTPGVALSLATFIEPELGIFGQFVNAFYVVWSFAFIFDALNSSVNIILYYKMSSKYRETFNLLFGIGETD